MPKSDSSPSSAVNWRELHELGFNLIPVRAGQKMPAIPWARYQTCRTTFEEISAWQREGHNAGIVTGAISNLVVLDCDTPEAIAHPPGTIAYHQL